MSYIGENVAVADFSKQTFPADSLEKVFTLSSSVANSSCLIVSVGGVIQEPDVAYTASGTTLTFSVAPTTGNDVYVIYIGKELPKTTHGDNTITNALIPDGIITSDKIQSLVPSKLTGALPAIDGSALTGIAVNTDSLEDNIALLGFKLAANNALAKYNLVDRTIDEYQDATGIDASASTNESAGGTGTGKYYQGESLQAGTLDSTTDVLLHFDEATFVDSSTHSRTVSNSVGSRSATKSKFGGYSLRTTTSPVTGLTVTHTTTKTLCDAFTIDYWFNFDAIVNNQYFYWGTTDLHWGMRFGMSGDNKMQWYLGPGTGDWTISAQSPGTQNGILGTKTDWVAGQWYHHAQVYDGTSYKMYVDGVQDGDALVTSNKISNGVGTGITQSYVGRNSVGSFNGYFDEFRISSGARWTSDFTPPTTAYPEDILTAGADMNLISTSTTASTAPTKGDITVLIEDNLGTATINTDIKGYVSRDGGTGWDQGTLIHEGTWGTNKKVLSFHDQTFSNSASGTDMKYKIETANQSYTVSDTSSTNSYTGANQTFTVPAGITSITFTGWGAGGGGGAPGGIGGGGGFISGNVTVTPGEVLDVKVGGGGQNSGQNNGYDHGGGGGGTGIYRGATVLAIAGAGGGGSGHGAGKATGGSGGGTTGGTAQVNSGGAALGGTQSAGGQGTSGGANTYGSLNQGGSVMDVAGGDGAGGYNGGGKGDNDAGSWTFNSGGGGGGYYGGSSGGESSSSTGPGAGGSSLTAGTNTQAPAYTGAAANNTHANYVAGVGVGGAAMAHGGNGLAIITYSEVSGKQTRIHATSLAWS